MPYGNYAQLQQFSPQQYEATRLQEQQMQAAMQQRQVQQAQQMQIQQAQAQQQQAQAQAQQSQQGAMEKFGGRFEEAMNNPMIAAALGAGSSILSAADRGVSTVGALGSGLLGGAGGFAGAMQRSKRERLEEEERRRLLQAISGRMGDVADDGRLPQMSVYQAMMGGLGN